MLVCSLCSQTFKAGLTETLLVCSQVVGRKAKPTFARLLAGSAGQGRREGGKAKAEQEGMAMIYLLKPSPPFVARLIPCIPDAKATVVAKIRIKQFWAVSLTGKVVAGPSLLATPCFFLYAKASQAFSRTGCGKNRQRGR